MTDSISTLQKALEINLDPRCYGTFAEIGAGQEVVRWFFQAGGAAGTIAKSISAYDMQVSDAIYGDCSRYVSRERLEAMLANEQLLNRQRLATQRGDSTTFFTFADTVSARNYMGTNECHAWLGIRFQHAPGSDDSGVILHLRMLDDTNAAQQETVGIAGVNLIHATLKFHDDPDTMLAMLTDSLSQRRVEVDMIDVSGPAFSGTDNRILSLRLVELGMTGAAMFSADGVVLQPSEALRKRPLLVQRGRFRPITHVNMDMLDASLRRFEAINGMQHGDTLPIMEISMHSLKEESEVCLEDFLSRAEVVATTGCNVLISDYRHYFRLAEFLCRYTDRPIGIAMGLMALQGLFEERYYTKLGGGILESFGRLFSEQVKLLIYPIKNAETGAIQNVESLELEQGLQHLLRYLQASDSILPLTEAAAEHLDIYSHDVLQMIIEGDEQWADNVPDAVATKIRDAKLFGYAS